MWFKTCHSSRRGAALFVTNRARILENSEASMTIISDRMSGRLSSIFISVFITIFVSLSMFVFPANAKTAGDNAASTTSNMIQFAQTRVCKRPNLMINGVCRRGIVKLRCTPPNKIINGRCIPPRAIRNPANLRKTDNLGDSSQDVVRRKK